MTRATVTAMVLVSGLAVTGVGLTSAAAKDDDDRREVELSGSCSRGADWELKAKERDGGLEVEFEVDSNRTGQRWAYRMSANGSQFASGKRRTKGPSGSFSIERRAGAAAGSTAVTARAQNLRSGEVCLATLSI